MIELCWPNQWASLEFAIKKGMSILYSEEIVRKIAEDDRRSVSRRLKRSWTH